MKMQTFSIFDVASGAYMRPFFMLSEKQAVRTFGELSMDAEHEVGKHPEDYSLVAIGEFDDQTGLITGEPVRVLTTGLAMVAASRRVASDNLQLFDDGIPEK